MVALWLAVGTVATPFVLYSAFLALCTLQSVRARGVQIPAGIALVGKLWFVAGVVADVMFNLTFGYYWFREWRGWTFSQHIQWRVDNGIWDPRTQQWTAFLNAAAPGHIQRVPS